MGTPRKMSVTMALKGGVEGAMKKANEGSCDDFEYGGNDWGAP